MDLARGRMRRAVREELGALVLWGLLAAASAVAEPAPLPALPSGFEEELARREYEATRNARGLQAPNRAHGLRTYFEPTGIRVHDRTAEGSPELLALTLVGVGRGGVLAPIAPGEVVPDGARVEIRRPGLVEWYENSDAGLEQGFSLAARPDGQGELVLGLALSGARATQRGDDLVFATRGGRSLRYGALHVVDAAGRALAARFELPAPDRVRIAVDDALAVYPLTVDPLLTQTSDTFLESNWSNSGFGATVASAGDVNGDGYADVIVGASSYDAGQNQEGAAFIFLGSATGVANGDPANAATRLEGELVDALMGSSVSSAGDVNGDGYGDVIVGASGYDSGEGTLEGSAFIFLGGPGGISHGIAANADTRLDGNQVTGLFGSSVASAGDVNGDGYGDVLVGAGSWTDGENNEGAVFVFHGGAGGIPNGSAAAADAQLEANLANAQFSHAAGAGDVDGDGYDDVIVGAPFYHASESDEGAAFIFLGGASGVGDGSPANADTQIESNQVGGQLGNAVAGAGDVNGDGYADVLIGAHTYDSNESNEGSVFVFLGGPGGIANGGPGSAAAELESDQIEARFGWSVAGAGDVNGDGYADVIASATLYDSDQTDEGAAFVFLGGSGGIASGPVTSAFVRLESSPASTMMGSSVAGAGDVNGDGYADVIVGNVNHSAGQAAEGAAFVYLGGAQGILDGDPSTAAAQLESDQENAELGWSVASAGDVNGDGYSDVIVGAPYYDAGQTDEGAAFVFLGSASGVADGSPASAAAQLESDQGSLALFGWSVASAGDVNGDGYGDVIVGAEIYGNGGAAFVFLGSASGVADGTPATADTALASLQGGSRFGTSVASAGDVNGDGYGDVIVGAWSYDAGDTDEGAAFVFLGSAAGIPDGDETDAAARLESNQVGGELGYSVAGAGDVNADGYGDVIVGAQVYDAGLGANQGSAFVFHGSASGVANGNPASANATLVSDQAGALFGNRVASAGDVNGDGYADVIVGANNYAPVSGQGAAFVFHGSATGIASGNPATADTRLEPDIVPASSFGSGVASAGDVNGDGYADVIVGAYTYNAGTPAEGAAFVFLGGASGIPDGTAADAAAQLESNQNSAVLGISVASAGDVNGDGYADVIAGAKGYSAGQTNEGAAFVFYGNGDGDGRRVLARQLAASGPSPQVLPWGASLSSSGSEATLRLNATHPQGRGRVKLGYEACAPGLAFGHPSCISGTQAAWTDVTATGAGVTLSLPVFAFESETLYRWRARVLYAPQSIVFIPAPTTLPPHGPWRRLFGQAVEGDLRTFLDTDEDGLRNLVDPDDDGDGLTDVAEVALGTNPLDPDHDDDGDLDGADNCPFVVNPAQANGDAYAAGDDCQCGDATGDGALTPIDYLRAREHVAGRTPSGAFVLSRCDVSGDGACAVEDLAILDRLTSGAPASIAYACPAYFSP